MQSDHMPMERHTKRGDCAQCPVHAGPRRTLVLYHARGLTRSRVGQVYRVSHETVLSSGATGLLRKLLAWREAAVSHIADLTSREHEIMGLVLAGQPSKNIAVDLGISQRTVENHRAAIMKKTGSKSLPALARLVFVADWIDAPELGLAASSPVLRRISASSGATPLFVIGVAAPAHTQGNEPMFQLETRQKADYEFGLPMA